MFEKRGINVLPSRTMVVSDPSYPDRVVAVRHDLRKPHLKGHGNHTSKVTSRRPWRKKRPKEASQTSQVTEA